MPNNAPKLARDQLAEREEDLRVMFETMPIGWAEQTMVFDSDGRPSDYVFRRVNAAFERFTGLTRDVIIGKRVTDLIPGTRDAKPDLIALYGEVVTTGEQRKLDLYFAPFDRWYSVTAFRRRAGTFVAMFEDITSRKLAEQEAEEEALKVHMFLDNTADLVTIVAPDGRFRYLNKAAKVVYGKSQDELVGTLALDLIHPDNRDSTMEAFGRWIAGRVES